ncbi:MAG: DUF3307 domain-containing protein [Chitinophagales bacterium]|nr:DUF3307 domain-containing protein [Chitinophagales bacterium]
MRSRADHKVTVVISVRNEADDILNCLQHILTQDYPSEKMEIIVVDDYSTDDTCKLVESITDDRVKLIKLKDSPGNHSANTPNKKYALTAAIEIAKGKLIMVTDGDCVMDPQWIRTISSFYAEYEPGFIASPVHLNGPRSFLTNFQKLDMLSMTGVAAAAIQNNNPTLSNAANMAFERNLFLDSGGFGVHSNQPSGDDLFLMHKFQLETDREVMYCKSNEAAVTSKTVNTLKDFIEQRKRWVSKSTTYQKKSVTFTLLLAYLVNLSIVVSGIFALLGSTSMLIYFLAALFSKLFIDFTFLYPVSRFFKRSSILYLFLPIQVVHILYVVTIGILGMFFNYEWRGRTVHKTIRITSDKVEN